MDRGYRNLPLNPLRAFAVASRHKTFTAAAKHMGISQVAISRQIAILERYLSVRLFERGSRSVKLTDVGRAFGHEIAGLFDDLERATERILSNETRNTIHLRIYPTVAHHFLLPRLPEFMARHPDYRVRFDTTVEPLDFRGTHLDVAIQLGRADWSDARCRKLFDEVLDVVASPRYLAAAGPLERPEDLAVADLLHSRYRRRDWETWAAAMGIDLNWREGIEFETSLLTYSACTQGLGVAIGQIDLLGNELASGELVRPFDRPHATGAAFYVVWPTLTSVSTKTRHFIDWVLESVGEAPEFYPARA
ncbi:LysR substrate-binding domain-containing protein [Acuticoccus mangrovi]|uniref:LysR family transcriptional regulator n=1 Tax=Acuticoccus mangrovi TaxID=2796142 RepID=A0A934MLK7_9HYPH|nr:LysR substrate-binding domain-containing protein [Acuticoccus mangrovi]MBJ3776459.1 LysR family transcriptional regulator [Acuticoccus mangrovi]